MSAIYILWKRELIRYFRSRARLVGSLGQPLLFLVALGFGLGPVFAKSRTRQLLPILRTGRNLHGNLVYRSFCRNSGYLG